MDFHTKNIPLIVYKNPINMHRSFNGLLSLAISELGIDFQQDSYVLFMNRDRNQFKILFIYEGNVSIFTMRINGRLRADFEKIDSIDSRFLHKLIKNPISRKSRLQVYVDA